MKNWILRYSVFIVGLYVLTLGIVLIVRSTLGTSPISSLAYVISINTPLSLGTCLFLFNMVLIIAQLWFARGVGNRRDRIEILLQIPFSVIFGAFTDLNMWLTSSVSPTGYAMQLALVAIGCGIQSLGIVLEVKPNVVAMSAEGFVKYAIRRYHKKFGTFKIELDLSLVVLAIVASLLLAGRIDGVREGTIIAALSVGWLVNVYSRLFARLPIPF